MQNSPERMSLKKRFASKYSITNFDEKQEDVSSSDEKHSEHSSESPQLLKKRSSRDSHKYVKTLVRKGQSEFQIALRKRFAGAKNSIENVK